MSKAPELFALSGKRIWVAGHRGLVGSALLRRLEREDCQILTAGSEEVDLRDRAATLTWLKEVRPEGAIIAAAKVGGILNNDSHPVDFLEDNLAIANSSISAAYEAGVQKLLFLGSSCIYPRLAPQPIPEEALLTGPLEPTNEWYAIAKIAGLKLCQAYRRQKGADFISAMPTNLYGPGDNFDPLGSHVIPGLMRRMHEAKTQGDSQFVVWGSGEPLREFLQVDDCADALIFLLTHYSGESHINLGTGQECSIRELAESLARIIDFKGQLVFDRSKPDGTPRKLLDVSKMSALGWRASTSLEDGLRKTYSWFLQNAV